MRLEVEPSDLKSFARQVGRAVDDITDGLQYVDKHTPIDWWEEGLLKLAVGPHRNVVDNVTGALSQLASVLGSCQSELLRVSAYYTRTDIDTARSIDATYPVTPR
ncbi:hypothetical protein [Streptomyces daliensis]|uniref:Excreted virulence factor EspC, type VII ESX diderm n=1 Tax=Streptomyces daliensis TaxID=299421 RepID=A0A8T4IUY5_9ACTN|nr:hypothetical protein [Streptomyces daliensis]